MKKIGKYIFGFVCFGIVVVFLLFTSSDSFEMARSSCKLFEEFQSYIVNNNWEKAEAVLFSPQSNSEQSYTDNINYYIENRPVIENGKLISSNGDVTEAIIKAKPKFWHTFDYYKSNKDKIGKVVLNNGYAVLLNDKIVFIKIP